MEPLETVVTCLLGLHDAKQKMVPCSVCDHGDEMMQIFGLERCAACDASDGQEEPSLSQATRASESEMEDEQVKTGEGKGKGSAPSTTPTLETAHTNFGRHETRSCTEVTPWGRGLRRAAPR